MQDHIVSKKVHAVQKGQDNGQRLKGWLSRIRLHKKKWLPPTGAEVILNMHFNVYSFGKHSFHADATLELPHKGGHEYYSVSHGGHTEAVALRRVIEEVENSNWFKDFKGRGVYFRITGTTMETLYKGYL